MDPQNCDRTVGKRVAKVQKLFMPTYYIHHVDNSRSSAREVLNFLFSEGQYRCVVAEYVNMSAN